MDNTNAHQEREIGTMSQQIKNLNDNLNEFKKDIKIDIGLLRSEIRQFNEIYVTKEEHKNDLEPIKKIVYGLVFAVLLAIVTIVVNNLDKIQA